MEFDMFDSFDNLIRTCFYSVDKKLSTLHIFDTVGCYSIILDLYKDLFLPAIRWLLKH